MAEKTFIEWCHHTFNMIWGCIECASECDHCYARILAHRYGYGWGKDSPRRVFGPKHWAEPLTWNRKAIEAGERRRIFSSSMADNFEDHPTVADERREKLWPLIDATPGLDWLLLTKRPGNFLEAVNVELDGALPSNVWAGTTLGHPKGLWRLKVLRDIPARVRFLSVEPLLADLGTLDLTGIHWVIVGGESGPKARPMHPDWARSIRDQCAAAGVPYFHKQNGEWVGSCQQPAKEWPVRHTEMKEAGKVHVWPYKKAPGPPFYSMDFNLRVGKKVAGRLLDGVLHDAFPTPEVARG